MQLVSFSGAQSSGKSTLLEMCANDSRFKKWEFVPEVTRYVNKQYSVPINERATDETQLLILNTHILNHTQLSKNTILDRCILDGYVYTKWLVLYNPSSTIDSRILDYASLLLEKLLPKIDTIFYTDPSIPLVDDGTRSVNDNFRNEIIELFDEVIYRNIHLINNFIKLSGSPEERFNTIIDTIL